MSSSGSNEGEEREREKGRESAWPCQSLLTAPTSRPHPAPRGPMSPWGCGS